MRGHDACNCVQQIASCGCQHCKTVGILPFHPAQNTRWPRQQDSPGRVAARREQTVRTPVLSSTLLLSDDVVDTVSSRMNSCCKDMTYLVTCHGHGVMRWQRHQSLCAPVTSLQRCSRGVCQHAIVARVVFDGNNERGH